MWSILSGVARIVRRLAQSSLLCAVSSVLLLWLSSVLWECARDEMRETRRYLASEIELWFGALSALATAFLAVLVLGVGLSAVYRGASLLKSHSRVDEILHAVGRSLSREEGHSVSGEDSAQKPENEWVLKMLRDLPREDHHRE